MSGFEAGPERADRLDLQAWGFVDFNHVLESTVDVGGDARIDLDDQTSIELVGVSSAGLHEDDFPV